MKAWRIASITERVKARYIESGSLFAGLELHVIYDYKQHAWTGAPVLGVPEALRLQEVLRQFIQSQAKREGA